MRKFEKIPPKQYKDFYDYTFDKHSTMHLSEKEKLDFFEEKLKEIKLPKRATAKSAGYDIYSPIDFTLKPGRSIEIPTGIRAIMEEDDVLKIHPRSGQGFRYFLRLANTTGK